MKILIADDNDVFRTFLAKIVVTCGCDVAFARDGAEALALMDEIQPDLVFTDINMPKVNGFGLLGAIRAGTAPNVPVIAITSQWSDHARADYIAAGFDWAIEKPLRTEQVVDVLRALTALPDHALRPPATV